jgi:flagellar hook-basal body complex protein FliE
VPSARAAARKDRIDPERSATSMNNDMTGLVRADLAAIAGNARDLGAATAVRPDEIGVAGAQGPASGFAGSMTEALRAVDAKEHAAIDKMDAVDSGRSDDLVGAMLASQEASLSFSMLMQVRNKVMGAVDDLVRLPL